MRPILIAAAAALIAAPATSQTTTAVGCDPDNAGLTLAPGFCAGVFARGIPAPRRIAVAPNGDVFVISNRGGGRGNPPGVVRGVFRLRDANRDGKADTVERVASGGGAGIGIAHGALYVEGGGGRGDSVTRSIIMRYPFRSGSTDLTGAADTIVLNLPMGGHATRDFVIRGNELFVNVGSQGNVCPAPRGEPAPDPCPELETRAGIWKFDATKPGQAYSAAQRYAVGVRNGTGLALNPRDNQLYVAQHGRDNLGQWNNNSFEYNAENPGEEWFKVVEGGEYGWPYCYYSHEVKKKVTGPEYGGDGKKDERCARMQQPVYAFPGHWAPNDALFYSGSQFPADYRNGVFVAFHGSWNRAPLAQAGFNVTFLPMNGDKASGAHRVVADGFYGDRTRPLNTPGDHRPTGLGQMIDGSLLVSDDVAGMIYRIVYRGN